MATDNFTNIDAGMDWDDQIENDGKEFVILEEGDYPFTVTNFERGRFPGSKKMSPCNKAILTLQVQTADGVAVIRTDLVLNRLVEWRISAFFRCIGQKKHGERLVMDWNHVVGSRGRAHFKPRTYTGNDGQEHTVNDCDRFYDYDPEKMPEETAGFSELSDTGDDLPF